jgi:tetratricopeptide (TPR) repeat protein
VTGSGAPDRLAGLPAAALALALAVLAALGVREVGGLDLGYHLAYGERILRGDLVDHSPEVYTLPPLDAAPGERPEPGPGAWYDAQGRYRFPNANWLSQALFAAWPFQGGAGLSALGALLVAALAAAVAWALARLEAPRWTRAPAVLLLALVGAARLNLRPELCGYVVLALELGLVGPALRGGELTRRAAWAFLALQLAFVNLHSYFPLGIALAGAVAVDGLARRAPDRRRRLALLAGAAAAALANPWTWRIAVLPVQTLLYLRMHAIAAGPGDHPWSRIFEFRPTLHPGFPATPGELALAAAAVLAVAGVALAARRRRWGHALALAGFLPVAFSMQRNVLASAVVIVPLAAAALPAWGARVRTAAGLGSALAALALIALVTSDALYAAEGQPLRFGLGFQRAHLPVGAAEWLDAELSGARVWTGMNASSTIHGFTEPHREVPLLTNTWAEPPAVMAESGRLRLGEMDFDAWTRAHDVDVAVLRAEWSPALATALARSPTWTPVYVNGPHVAYLRAGGRFAADARRLDLRARGAEAARYAREQRALDADLDASLLASGPILLEAGAFEHAREVFALATAEAPERADAWNGLGAACGSLWMRTGDAGERERAEAAFRRALALDPDAAAARRNLEALLVR